MKPITAKDYNIEFGSQYKMLSNYIELQQYSKIFILVDIHTKEYCLPFFSKNLVTNRKFEIISIKAGEENKHIGACLEVWTTLSNLGADRKSLLINLGGGVVTDLGGFVAATFKRGIDFINVPTTLLSMVDASVGGKTGVDLKTLKNQIGTITNPKMVLVDNTYLETLPLSELKSGYAEMFKHCLICDKKHWEFLSDFKNIDNTNTLELIHYSVSIKNDIVLQDPYENGLRKTLNFGHTLGHAIESYCLNSPQKATLLHGEAIIIGMILEAFLSTKLVGLELETCNQIKTVFNTIYIKVEFNKEEIDSIIDLLQYDKKNSHGKVKFVLLKSIGEPVIDVEIPKSLLKDSFEYYIQ